MAYQKKYYGLLVLWLGMAVSGCFTLNIGDQPTGDATDAGKDVKEPVVVDGTKNLLFGKFSHEGFEVSWEALTQNTLIAPQVKYQVYTSGQNNIGDVAAINANGTLQGEVTGATFMLVSRLSSSSRYFVNVLATEPSGTQTSYNSAPAVTENMGVEELSNWNIKIDSNLDSNKLFSIALDSRGNLYAAGYGRLLFSETSGSDWWIKKFSPTGVEDTVNWNKIFDASVIDTIERIVIDSSDQIYVAGYGLNLAGVSSSIDVWIKKFSPTGVEDTVNWNKKLSIGADVDIIYDVAVDSAGNLYVAGYAKNLAGPVSGIDGWVKKFSSGGVEDIVNWNKIFNLNGTANDYVRALAIDANDNVYVAGYSEKLVSNLSGIDVFLKKFDSSGNEDLVSWNKWIDQNMTNDMPSALAVDSAGNLYYGGYVQNLVSSSSKKDWVIKKFTFDGTEITSWNLAFDHSGGDDFLYALAVSKNDHLYAVGSAFSTNTSATSDWWLKKFSPDATEDTTNWNFTFDRAGSDTAYDIVINGRNEVYVAGDGTSLVSSTSGADWWIKKFR